jgi:ABC-type transport system substrate-binding protein
MDKAHPIDDKTHVSFLSSQEGKKPFDLEGGGFAILSFSAAVYGQPLYVSEAFEVQPGFIESWRWDFKEKFYELKLQKGLKFHNGRGVNARDLEFLLLKGFFTTVKLMTTSMLANIEGVEKIAPGTKYRSGLVSGVQVVDDLTLRVKLKSPNPAFLYTIARPVPSLVPMEEMQEDLITPKGLPIGSGPYRVAWSDPQSSLVRLELVDTNLKQAPKTIDFVASGNAKDFDISVAGPGSLPPSTSHFFHMSNTLSGTGLIGFNFQSPLGSNEIFRRAIYYAIDRNAVVQDIKGYEANSELLPKQYWGRLNIAHPYDLKKAKELVSLLPKELTEKTHNAYVSGLVSQGKPVERIQAQLEAAGLKFQFENLNSLTFPENDDNTPLIMYGALGNFLDPLNMFSGYLPGSFSIREFPKNDPIFSKLYIEAAQAESLEIRASTIRQLSKHFLDTPYAVPVFSDADAFWVNQNKVKDFGLQNGGAMIYFSRIKMK